MTTRGYYYLHENGSLIWKVTVGDGQVADFRESDLVRYFWPLTLTDRQEAWGLLVEASALGADVGRVSELAAKWECDDSDAMSYADRIGVVLTLDGDRWCATRKDFVDLVESPAGFGDSCLHAMACLCRALGFKARKMWGQSFADLVEAGEG